MTTYDKCRDDLWSKAVKVRDHHTCRRCHRTTLRVESHHILPRDASKTLRWNLDNGVTLCAGIGSCHDWATANKAAALLWARQLLGDAHIDQLEVLRHSRTRPPTLDELEQIEKTLKEEISKHKKEKHE